MYEGAIIGWELCKAHFGTDQDANYVAIGHNLVRAAFVLLVANIAQSCAGSTVSIILAKMATLT